MSKRVRAEFLNLDMELDSPKPLSKMRKYLSASAHILYNGRIPGGYRLCAEPIIGGKLSQNPRACTKHFLDALEKLPDELKVTFAECKRRVFDYGFDGGLESRPLAIVLSKRHLDRMARLGIELRITVYPYRAINEGI